MDAAPELNKCLIYSMLMSVDGYVEHEHALESITYEDDSVIK